MCSILLRCYFLFCLVCSISSLLLHLNPNNLLPNLSSFNVISSLVVSFHFIVLYGKTFKSVHIFVLSSFWRGFLEVYAGIYIYVIKQTEPCVETLDKESKGVKKPRKSSLRLKQLKWMKRPRTGSTRSRPIFTNLPALRSLGQAVPWQELHKNKLKDARIAKIKNESNVEKALQWMHTMD